MLAGELRSWPHIATQKMFGFEFYYRKSAVFSALPQTRGFDSPSTLIIKFNPMPAKLLKRAQGDPRMDASTRVRGSGWFSFRMHSEADLRDALWWLSQAYEASGR